MTRNRSLVITIVILILIGIVGGVGTIAANVLTNDPPDWLDRLSGLALPIFIVCVVVVIGLSVLQHVNDQNISALDLGTSSAAVALPQTWHIPHPYAMAPNFTGRRAERKELTNWLNNNADCPMMLVRALGGFGKSALAWQWLTNDVDRNHWQRVVWWSFYEGDASFDLFLPDTLRYLGIDPNGLGRREQAEALLEYLKHTNVLLVLDGFERTLRAFSGLSAAYQDDQFEANDRQPSDRDCVSPIADDVLRKLATLPHLRGKVLLTTRLRPRALEERSQLLAGCHELELTGLSPDDAVNFFQAQGVRGNRNEIEQVCKRYGYHPLALRLLTGLIVKDLRQPGDIAVADRLDINGDLIQRRNHVLQHAYEQLTRPRRRLLSRIACFRGAVTYATLAETERPVILRALRERVRKWTQWIRKRLDLDTNLRDLIDCGLLQHTNDRFDLHPIVRQYAYTQLGAVERRTIHDRLRYHFECIAPPPTQVRNFNDLQLVIEVYYHTARSGRYDLAHQRFRDYIHQATYYQFGAYEVRIELLRMLFPDGEDQLPRLRDESSQGWTLNALAISYSLSGQRQRAERLFEQINSTDQGHKHNHAVGLSNMATQQLAIGALRQAEMNLRRSIVLFRENEEPLDEAAPHAELGRLLTCRGAWAEAEAELAAALARFEEAQELQPRSVIWAYRAERALMIARAATSVNEHLRDDVFIQTDWAFYALEAAQRALELANETARIRHPVEHDYVWAHWLLGAPHQ